MSLQSSSGETSITKKDKATIKPAGKANFNYSYMYHESEIQGNNIILINAIIMMYFGLAAIIGGIIAVFCGYGSEGFFSSVAGAITYAINAGIIGVLKFFEQNKKDYYKILTEVQRENVLYDIIKKCETKNELVKIIVQNKYPDKSK